MRSGRTEEWADGVAKAAEAGAVRRAFRPEQGYLTANQDPVAVAMAVPAAQVAGAAPAGGAAMEVRCRSRCRRLSMTG
jgi:hypothetical protein